MKVERILLTALVLAVMGGLFAAQTAKDPPVGQAMIAAANAFRKSLTPDQLKQCSFSYQDEERLNWHFIPRERKGLPLRDLEGEALKLAREFIRSGLTEAGYDQVLNIMSLEEVLYLLEANAENAVRSQVRERRDPGKYHLSIFGEPAEKGLWGWRLEGHHLSLNFSIQDGKVVASTPEFFGANPGTIDAGPERRIRVLGPEEDIARQILKLCTPEQMKLVLVSKTPPKEVPGPGAPQAEVGPAVGLPYVKMSDDQKKLLQNLLSEYLKNLPTSIEQERRAEIQQAGLDHIHFAWWGESELNQPHHYRVQGPTFVIEYNNTQNNANHVHSMWRSLKGDFNIPREPAK
jgi:hypothetical protein